MSKPPKPTPIKAPNDTVKDGDRIAKVLARAGVASRRGAEIIIAEGRVAVNGERIDSPALNIAPGDKITVDGKPLAKPEPIRVWMYHKPLGLVTSERDEKGRATVFDNLPEEMPRVMSIGRLDLNSEGLLLLTNDGELKRRLELPATGWLRKYRVRVNGTPTEASVAPLKRGITLEGERFQPMMVTIDKQQGANAWLTVGIREGRNREIRRALESVGLTVNRLIRTAYGPFQLGNLAPGAVEEMRPKTLRDQLGLQVDEVAEGRAAPMTQVNTKAKPARKPGGTAGATLLDGRPEGRKSEGRKSEGRGPARGGPNAKPYAKPTGKPTGKDDRPERKGPDSKGPDRKSPDSKGPERKSWGTKSHGGGRKNADGTAAQPRSWGTKSARSTSTTPRKPGSTR